MLMFSCNLGPLSVLRHTLDILDKYHHKYEKVTKQDHEEEIYDDVEEVFDELGAGNGNYF